MTLQQMVVSQLSSFAAVAIVLLLVILIALCGVEYTSDNASGARRRLRIRRLTDRR